MVLFKVGHSHHDHIALKLHKQRHETSVRADVVGVYLRTCVLEYLVIRVARYIVYVEVGVLADVVDSALEVFVEAVRLGVEHQLHILHCEELLVVLLLAGIVLLVHLFLLYALLVHLLEVLVVDVLLRRHKDIVQVHKRYREEVAEYPVQTHACGYEEGKVGREGYHKQGGEHLVEIALRHLKHVYLVLYPAHQPCAESRQQRYQQQYIVVLERGRLAQVYAEEHHIQFLYLLGRCEEHIGEGVSLGDKCSLDEADYLELVGVLCELGRVGEFAQPVPEAAYYSCVKLEYERQRVIHNVHESEHERYLYQQRHGAQQRVVVVLLVQLELLLAELVLVVDVFYLECVLLGHQTDHIYRVLLRHHIQREQQYLRQEREDDDTESVVADYVEYERHRLAEDIA